MIGLLVYLVIAVIVLSFAYYVIANFLPQPMQRFAFLVLGLIAVIFLIYLLLGLVGGGGYAMHGPLLPPR